MSAANLGALLDGDQDDILVYLDDAIRLRAEIRAMAVELGAGLEQLGLRGKAIGVLLPNTAATMAAWFGIWRVDSAFVPLNPRAPAAELAELIARTAVSAVVTQSAQAELVAGGRRVQAGVYTIVVLEPPRPRSIVAGDAIIQFTSGTTGAPKAVALRHDTVQELLDSVIGSLRGGRKGDRAQMPNIVPMSLSLWAGIYQVLFAFTLGVPVVLMHAFEPREFARLVATYGIRSSVLPPAALPMLLGDPQVTSLEPLRYVRSVSAPLSPEHARRFHDRFGIAVLNGYGQTELGGEAVGWSADDWKQHGVDKLGSVGRPHDAFQLRVRADDGSLAPADEIGELEITSRAAPTPADAAMEGRITDDGWLRTGDLARIDADGFVWIEGRMSDMINRGGLKVFPDEVEERLRAHPDIVDVAVVGVPDDRLGEVPWAFVVPQAGRTIDAGALQTWSRPHMAAYKIPTGVTVVDALPRNEIGKVLRHELAERQR